MQFIYRGSKFRQSGTTMQKSAPASEVARREAVRRVLPGFPATPFSRINDIEAYISGDTITCLVCGQERRGLIAHVRSMHDMDATEYRQRFNIPSRFSLLGTATREKRRKWALREENMVRIAQLGRESRDRDRTPASSASLNTTFRKDASLRSLRIIDDKGLRAHKETDYAWHLDKVRNYYNFQAIEPPPGELSWSGYKKHRAKDPELKSAHKVARTSWRANEQGKVVSGARVLNEQQRAHFTQRLSEGLNRGEARRLAQEWGVSESILSTIKRSFKQ